MEHKYDVYTLVELSMKIYLIVVYSLLRFEERKEILQKQ